MAPTTGERFFREPPSLNAESFQRFLDAVAAAFSDRLNSLLLENRGAHTAPRLPLPANVRLVFLPPDCPELNPIERVWRDLQESIAWQQFRHVDAPQDELSQLWQAYDAPTRHSLTGDTYLVEAVNARLT